jgi:ABC-type branched-subunit amino acid transport system permease subunit
MSGSAEAARSRRRPAIAIPLVLHARSGLIAMLLCLAAGPAVLSDYQLTLYSTAVAYAVGVLGVAVGFASVGMLALTQPAMMLVGAYVALHLIERWQVPFLVAAAAATMCGVFAAIPLGWLTSRLDRFSFAVLGFAFTFLVATLMSSSLLVDVTGGELGKAFPVATVFERPLQGIAGYALVAVIALSSYAAAAIMFRSTFGRLLLMLNEDDMVAQASGASTSLHRIAVTAIVSGYGALSGALIGQASGFIAPPQFDVALSIALLAMALVGGTQYLFGAFAGTMLLSFVPALLGLAQVDREILVGTILLVCLVAVPKGILAALPIGAMLPFRGMRQRTTRGARDDAKTLRNTTTLPSGP